MGAATRPSRRRIGPIPFPLISAAAIALTPRRLGRVGIGEVVLPQLVKQCCMPLPVAAGTSVAVVVTTAAVAAVVQFVALAQATGGDLVSVVPWQLVRWTIPGVLIGGQLAPYLASRGAFTDEQIERFAAALFAVVGAAFAAKALVST